MFLVMLRFEHEDLPLYLCKHEGQAVEFARNADWIPDARTCELFHSYASGPISMVVVEFRNGKPWNSQIVRSFEQESEAEEQAEKKTAVKLYDPEN
jgi:hypothetical protein